MARHGLDYGLVGEWRFDRNTGLVVPDTSGFGNHGVLQNDVAWVASTAGVGLEFANAPDDAVHGGNFNVDKPISLELFYHWYGAAGTWQGLITKRDAYVEGEMEWQLVRHSAGELRWMVITQTAQTFNDKDLAANVDEHLIFVDDGTDTHLYYDGEWSESHSTLTFGSADTADIVIGNSQQPSGTEPFNGIIYLARIYNRALSAAEVSARYEIVRSRAPQTEMAVKPIWTGFSAPTDKRIEFIGDVRAPSDPKHQQDTRFAESVVGEWRFDRNTGVVVPDHSGHNNLGNISGCTWTATQYGIALELDGSTDSVEIDSLAEHLPTLEQQGTIETCFILLSMPPALTDEWIFGILDSAVYNSRIYLIVGDDDGDLKYRLGTDGPVDTGVDAVVGELTHYAVTWNNRVGQVHINGIHVVADDTFANTAGTYREAALGSYLGLSNYSNIQLLTCRAYSSELSAAEVSARYDIVRRRGQGEKIWLALDGPVDVEEEIPTNLTVSVSDSITIGEAVDIDLLSIFKSDGVTVGESVDVSVSAPTNLTVDISDSITLGENVSVTLDDLAISESDNITVADVAALLIDIEISESDGITVADSPTVALDDLVVSESDGLTLGESVDVDLLIYIAETDSVTVSDSSLLAMDDLAVSGSDGLTIDDSPTVSMPDADLAVAIVDTDTDYWRPGVKVVTP